MQTFLTGSCQGPEWYLKPEIGLEKPKILHLYIFKSFHAESLCWITVESVELIFFVFLFDPPNLIFIKKSWLPESNLA